MRHPQSTEMVTEVRPGDLLPYLGGVSLVLKAGRVQPDGDGSFAQRVVLHTTMLLPEKIAAAMADRRRLTVAENLLHPFAVHALVYDDENHRWLWDSGDYAESIEDGLARYASRAREEVRFVDLAKR